MDTIFALATPEGKSGVAIVRISGQDAFECFKNFSCKIVKVGRSGVRKLMRQNWIAFAKTISVWLWKWRFCTKHPLFSRQGR